MDRAGGGKQRISSTEVFAGEHQAIWGFLLLLVLLHSGGAVERECFFLELSN